MYLKIFFYSFTTEFLKCKILFVRYIKGNIKGGIMSQRTVLLR